MLDRIELARSKLAGLYRQIFLGLVLAELLDLHFRDNCTPLWSEEPRGGMTVHEDNKDGLEIMTRSIKELLPKGLV